MRSVARLVVVAVIGLWMLGTALPDLSRVWDPYPSNGLTTDYDGVVTAVDPNSPAERLTIVPGDRILAPLPRDLFRSPPGPMSFQLMHAGAVRPIDLMPARTMLARVDKIRLIALYLTYLIFLVVGSAVLLLRPSPTTWAFYLYCVLRRYGDAGFYWPGSDAFFWSNLVALAAFGGASCALVAIFALRFPENRLVGWRSVANRVALALAFILPIGWLYATVRPSFMGQPSQELVNVLVWVTSAVYLAAAAIFIVTLLQSSGDARQRLEWILVFPLVLIMRVAAINVPSSLLSDSLTATAVIVPITVAYTVVTQRVFDIEFVISRALVYGSITTMVAGTFLLLDWFLSQQFNATRFTLTAEIIVALAFGSWLNILHHNVDRFVDSTFFRARHQAEKRLARAAAALARAESHEAVDRFMVHEPVQALALTSGALFRRSQPDKGFTRELAIGWGEPDLTELTADHPLVLHLLAEGAPVRLADVRWSADDGEFRVANSVLAAPVLLREQLAAIVFYGPHRSGADIDPDEIRSLAPLTERAGAAYDHIEVQSLRAVVEALMEERETAGREMARLRDELSRRSGPEPGHPSPA